MTALTTIAIDERGLATLEIPDTSGEVHSYTVAAADRPARLVWSVWVLRTDGEGESPYRVSLTDTGAWLCTCPDARYRARKESRLCKHQRSIRALHVLIRRLLNQPPGV